MNLLVVVTARKGSKRLPGKNVRLLCGRSLLGHTAAAIDAADLGAEVILTTDDERAVAEGERLGWRVPFRRPNELSGDHATSGAAVLHALDFMKEQRGSDPDAVMLLQPTSPLRGAEVLTLALERFREDPAPDSVVAVTPLGLDPSYVFTCDTETGFLRRVAAGNGEGIAYVPNGALYLTRTGALRETGSFYGGRLAAIAMDPVRSIDIDTEQDFKLAECALEAGVALERPHVVGRG